MPSATAYSTEINKSYLPAMGPPRPLEKGWVHDPFSMSLAHTAPQSDRGRVGDKGLSKRFVCSLTASAAVLSSASSEQMLDYYSITSEDCRFLFSPSLSASHNMVLYTSPLSFACSGV